MAEIASRRASLKNLTELTISLGVVSVAGLVFLFAIEKFHIWEESPEDPEAKPYTKPQFDYSSHVWLGNPGIAAATKYSLAFVLTFAIGIAILPGHKLESRGVDNMTVKKARGESKLFIDGNRDGYGVNFDHAMHMSSPYMTDSCATCHHLNMPLDKNSGCWQCHRNMYVATNIFDHDWHSSPEGADIKCVTCQETKFIYSSNKQRNNRNFS